MSARSCTADRPPAADSRSLELELPRSRGRRGNSTLRSEEALCLRPAHLAGRLGDPRKEGAYRAKWPSIRGVRRYANSPAAPPNKPQVATIDESATVVRTRRCRFDGAAAPVVAHGSDGPSSSLARAAPWRRALLLAASLVALLVGLTLQPHVARGAPSAVVNPDLEQVTGGVPNCFSRSGWGAHTVVWSITADSHSGTKAQSVRITNYRSGDRKLIPTENGTCAPAVVPGQSYDLSVWYKFDVGAQRADRLPALRRRVDILDRAQGVAGYTRLDSGLGHDSARPERHRPDLVRHLHLRERDAPHRRLQPRSGRATPATPSSDAGADRQSRLGARRRPTGQLVLGGLGRRHGERRRHRRRPQRQPRLPDHAERPHSG